MSNANPVIRPVFIPQFTSHEEARQAMSQSLQELQRSILTSLPITSYNGSRISGVGIPQENGDVVTLGYLRSVLPAVFPAVRNPTLVSTSTGSSTTSGGGAVLKTANYTAVAGDSGTLIVLNSSSSITLTLPASPPFATWNIHVDNIGTGEAVIARNGLNIDGVASNLNIAQFQGVYITTDGTNYFTARGGPIPGTSIIDSTANPVLHLTSTTTGVAVLKLTANNSSGGIALDIDQAIFGVRVQLAGGTGVLTSVSSGLALQAIATSGTGIDTSSTGNNPALLTSCSGNGPDIQLSRNKLYFAGNTTTLPALAVDGMVFFWTAGQNFLEDGLPVGSVAVAGTHKVLLCHAGGSWRTLC